MNRMIAVVLLCAMSGGNIAVANADPPTEHSSQKLTMHFAAPGEHTLEVRAVEGNITVAAYDGADVEMTWDRSITARDEAQMRAAERDVVLDTRGDAATIRAIVRYPNEQTCGGKNGYTSRSGYHVRYDLTIRVPRTVRLQLCTINSSTVSVSGSAGDFDITNINGRITLIDVSGSGSATAVNGAVAASFTSAPRHASTFRTTNGDVAVTLPAPPSSTLHLKTFNGRVMSDFASPPGAASPLAGKAGGDLTLETLNGDVHILRRPS